MVLGAVLLDRPANELVVIFPTGADVHVKHVGRAVVDLVLVEHAMLGVVHAADLRAVGNALGVVSRAHATDEHHGLRRLAVGRPPDFTAGRARGRNQPLELQRIDHVLVFSVAVFAVAGKLRIGLLFRRIVKLVAGGDDDRADLLGDKFVLIVEADRLGGAFLRAHAAFALGEFHAHVFVDHRPGGHGLRERDVDGRPITHAVVKLAGVPLRGAGVPALAAAGTFRHVDIAGLLADFHLEIAHVALDALDFAIGVQLDVWMLADIDHPRREDAL